MIKVIKKDNTKEDFNRWNHRNVPEADEDRERCKPDLDKAEGAPRRYEWNLYRGTDCRCTL